ncbi:MAG: hypothetical protein ABIP75_09610 [Pyrinomonadaceae bacterium]
MDDDLHDHDGAYTIVNCDHYDVAILTGCGGLPSLDLFDDNVDVEVRFKDGRFYAATFFTVENLKSLFAKFRHTGEFNSGLYFSCPDMVMVETFSAQNILETVASLVKADRLGIVFKLHIQDED